MLSAKLKVYFMFHNNKIVFLFADKPTVSRLDIVRYNRIVTVINSGKYNMAL